MNRRRFLSLIGGAGLAHLSFGSGVGAQSEPGTAAGSAGPKDDIPGVSPLEIRLGTSFGSTGSDGPEMFDYLLSFLTLINETNAQGGVHNRRLTLLALDHGDRANRVIDNTVSLLEEPGIFALVAYGGTSSLLSILPLLRKSRFPPAAGPDIPLFGAWSGVQAIYKPPYGEQIFQLRPSFGDEMLVLVEHLKRQGRQRIGLCYSLDATGQAIRDALEQAIQHHGLTLAAEATCAAGSDAVEPGALGPAVRHLHGFHLDSVVCALDARRIAGWLQVCADRSWPIPIALPSTVGGEALLALLDKKGRADLEQELIQSRVVPILHGNHPDAQALRELTLRRRPDALDPWRPDGGFQDQPWTAAGLEGFLTAKALVRTLEAAGPDLDRANLRRFWTETTPPAEPIDLSDGNEPPPATPEPGRVTEVILARAAADGTWREIPRLSSPTAPQPPVESSAPPLDSSTASP